METIQLKALFRKFNNDNRLTLYHVSAYHALLQLWITSNEKDSFYISRKKVMAISRIRSIATYHKCIKELVKFGYIKYQPSYNPYLGSKVWVVE